MSVEELLDDLKSYDSGKRLLAIQKIGKMQKTEAVEPLSYLLNDIDIDIRKHAAIALGKIGDSSAAGLLFNAAISEEEPEVRESIDWAAKKLLSGNDQDDLFSSQHDNSETSSLQNNSQNLETVSVSINVSGDFVEGNKVTTNIVDSLIQKSNVSNAQYIEGDADNADSSEINVIDSFVQKSNISRVKHNNQNTENEK
ncbi:HEAT repeat domain-containing protein [Methanohalophilus sp.]